ncbi:MAG: hypothetical protein M1821_004590 [Bathelium mastoideum]|nr:MAG: hypothetical protein M1821_004590 [Bathelium mastoideum]
MSTRLAPQHTLPTIMLDALIGYLYLVAPPPGALHRPVDPSNLILAGESGGATLHLAVLQFIQYFSSLPSTQPLTPPTLQIRGVHVALKMPRGCAFHSPPCDLLSALPAAQTNESIDWMPERGPWFNDDFPADHVWPSSPPRAEIYVDATAMTHPLVQPSCWTHWKGMPPMWISCGQERYADGIKYLVRNLWRDGVKVRFLEYDGMVHSFAVGMPWMPQSKHCMKLWGEACREISEVGEKYEARANGVAMGKLDFRELEFEELIKVEHDEVMRKLNGRVERLKERIWTGPKDQKAKI